MINRQVKILAIDDQYFARFSLSVLLNSGGYSRVESVASAEAAIDLFVRQRFGLLIIDVELDGMSGLELVKRIRSGKTAQPPGTPIIILTAHRETPVLGTAIALDVNGFIYKDKLEKMLYDRIEQALSEEASIRNPLGYSVINTSLTLMKEVAKKASPALNEQVPVDKLQPKMILAADVLSKQGHLLLPAGHHLTDTNICRLWEIHEVLQDQHLLITTGSLSKLFDKKTQIKM